MYMSGEPFWITQFTPCLWIFHIYSLRRIAFSIFLSFFFFFFFSLSAWPMMSQRKENRENGPRAKFFGWKGTSQKKYFRFHPFFLPHFVHRRCRLLIFYLWTRAVNNQKRYVGSREDPRNDVKKKKMKKWNVSWLNPQRNQNDNNQSKRREKGERYFLTLLTRFALKVLVKWK